MDFLNIIKAILQGIVQGITEWLPISSTGHILLLDALWPMDVRPEFFLVFEIVIQLGSVLAVILLYFNRLNPFSPRKTDGEKKGTWILWLKILIASIPSAIAGLLLDDLIDAKLRQPLVIAITLFVYGVALILIESFPPKKDVHSLKDISCRRALGIGAFQMLALIPGTSRSGSTILGSTLFGTDRPVAAEFSFFMAIPVMLGASGFKMVKILFVENISFSVQEWSLLVIGTAVSFIVSLAAIRFFMGYIRKRDFKAFGWYRIVLAAAVVVAICCNVFSK